MVGWGNGAANDSKVSDKFLSKTIEGHCTLIVYWITLARHNRILHSLTRRQIPSPTIPYSRSTISSSSAL
jgi:hypothetical protein